MDLVTILYKVGDSDVEFGAVSMSDDAVSLCVTKAKAIQAFVSATGDTCFTHIRFAATRKDGSEFAGQFGVAAAPVRVTEELAQLLGCANSRDYADCTGSDAVSGLRVRPVNQPQMNTDGDNVWFTGIIGNCMVETGRIPVSALDDEEAS
jgi:hypothetical protein